MPGGFFIYKAAEPEELLFANKAVFDIFGCEDLEDFKAHTGYTFKGMLHPEDYKEITASIVSQIGKRDDHLDHVEYRIIAKDGSIRWVDDYGHFTETEAYGGIYYVFISDITEKKEQEQSDKAMRQAVIQALSESYRAMWLVDDLETGNFIFYRGASSEMASEIENYRNPDGSLNYYKAKKYYVETTVDEADKERFDKEMDLKRLVEKLEENPQYSITYLRIMKDGSRRFFEIEYARLNMPGGKTGIVIGFKDVDAETRETLAQNKTLSEALEAAQQANRAKSAFLSNMSHEIRTPMNAIISLDNIALSDAEISDRTKEYLEKIGTSANHLLSIINDILDMSRIESGRMVINNEVFSFTKIMDQVTTMIGGQCHNKGLVFEHDISGDICEYYFGDDMKLKQILINILGNAVKFTPAGGRVSLKVEEQARFDDNSTLRFTIADTGIGMSSEYLPRIFDAFSQEDSSTTNLYGSTGLGMPITKSLVELMNGTIKVESEKGTGTTFTVTVTLKASGSSDDSEKRSEAAEEHDISRLKGRRILLAEDVMINAEIMIMVLSMRGMEVEHVENGKLAVDSFEEHEPGYYDAILVDMRMPVMDGLEATRTIRALEREDAKKIPIIALTANAFDEDVQRSLQAGLNAHLSKPVEPEALFDTLEKLINRQD